MRRIGASAGLCSHSVARALGCAALLFGCSSTNAPPAPSSSSKYVLDGVLHLNEIQIKATHNSYHIETPGTPIAAWRYTHDPLDVQLEDEGVRGLELDTHFDPSVPGSIAVYHVAGGDEQTVCRQFTDCLMTVKTWSDAHPGHPALFIQIEPKEISLDQTVDFAAYSDALDAAILSVWPKTRLIEPADIQGSAATLREAVTTKGWPTLGETRGKALFYMNDYVSDLSGNTNLAFHDAYTRGGSDISGRVVFPQANADEPIAGVVILNTPSASTTDVVRQHFIVRAQVDGVPPAADVATTRETGLATGAQILSTDYPIATDGGLPAFELPGGTPSRCNPVNAPASCTSAAVENPTDLVGY